MFSIKVFFLCALTFKFVLGGGDGAAGQLPQLADSLDSIVEKFLEVSKNITQYDSLIQSHIVQSSAVLSEEIPKSEKSLVLQKLFDVLQQNNLYAPPSTPEAPQGRSDDYCARLTNILTNFNVTRSNLLLRKASNTRFLEALLPVLNDLKSENFENEKLSKSIESANKLSELLQAVNVGFSIVEAGTTAFDDAWNGLSSVCPNLNPALEGKILLSNLPTLGTTLGNILFNPILAIASQLAGTVKGVSMQYNLIQDAARAGTGVLQFLLSG